MHHSLSIFLSFAGAPCSPTGLNLFHTMSVYLFPLVIEFALIAAAILYKLVNSIGAFLNPEYDTWMAENHTKKKAHNHECHKATSGVLSGLLVFTAMFAVTLAFMISDDDTLNGYLYLSGDLAIHVIALVTCILAFCQLSKLSFAGHAENPIDEYLIVICLAGLYFLIGAKVIASFSYLGVDSEFETYNILHIVVGIVSFIQATVQVIFIIDSFRREATTPKLQYEKPGRSLVSFLLFSNLAMWLINSFQLKETGEVEVMKIFYGDLAWNIILYLTLPLAVFFRFHSVVCLSDIWIEAYKRRCHAVYRIKLEDFSTDPSEEKSAKQRPSVSSSGSSAPAVEKEKCPMEATERDTTNDTNDVQLAGTNL